MSDFLKTYFRVLRECGINPGEYDLDFKKMPEDDLGQLGLVALRLLKRGDCWCEMATKHPAITEHSEGCKLAQEDHERAVYRRR